MAYIHALPQWPSFQYDWARLVDPLARIHYAQGHLLGRMRDLGFELQARASVENLTEEVVKSSEIEGEKLDRGQVRSSVARRLGVELAGLVPTERDVDGIVDVMLDATQNYEAPLTRERLFNWHGALFPTGRSGMRQIIVGEWRTDRDGPMRIVSGPVGRETVHFQAPAAQLLDAEMDAFLRRFNHYQGSGGPVLEAAIAHLWYVTIHPFDDGNGRIARALSDMLLARSEKTPQRFYSLSSQIRKERSAYYDILEETQRGNLEITTWVEWFLECLGRALHDAETSLEAVISKRRYWLAYDRTTLNARQRHIINALIDGFEGKLTSTKWAKITKVSPDTALRDIEGLLRDGILKKDSGGGRSTSYSLVIPDEQHR